ncbi:MAG TPA: O-antigen ligase family protein [Gammaproteobacteria bacterium]
MSKSPWSDRLLRGLAIAFPFISVSVPGGGSAIYTLFALAGLLFGWAMVVRSSASERRWWLALLLFFLLASVSLAYSADVVNGMQRLERFFRLATLGLLFAVMVRWRVVADRLFILGLMAAALSLFVQTLYEIHWLQREYAEGLYHKIIFGDMAMLIALLLFTAVLTLLRGWLRLLALLCIPLALYASVMSATRGAWLVLPFIGLTLAWLYRRRIDRRLWWLMGGALAVLLAMAMVLRPAPLVGPLERGVHELRTFIADPSAHTSWGDRLNMWRNATIIWWENPLLGTGIGDFNHDTRELVAQGRSLSSDVVKYGHAHSIYFDTLATLGLVGLIVLAFALFLLPGRYFYRAWQQGGDGQVRFAALAGLLTVVAFAVFGFSEGWLSRNPFVNPYIVYLALFAATIAAARNRTAA